MTKLSKTTILLLVFFSSRANGQEHTCFIKYASLKTNTKYYNSWFLKENLYYTIESNFVEVYKTFPVSDNKGNIRTETDTVKYNKEFKEHIDFMKSSVQSLIAVNKRNLNSNIQLRYHPARNGFDKIIVVDTIKEILNWEILEDTTTYLNYKCQKATTLQDSILYTAWFTTQLPYNAGPEKFSGLPGLILKVYNEQKNQGFEALEIIYPFKQQLPFFDETCKNTISMKEFLMLLDQKNKKKAKSVENIKNFQNIKEN